MKIAEKPKLPAERKERGRVEERRIPVAGSEEPPLGGNMGRAVIDIGMHMKHVPRRPETQEITSEQVTVDVNPGTRSDHQDKQQQHVQKRDDPQVSRSEEHTSELQSLMRITYAVFCLKKKQQTK